MKIERIDGFHLSNPAAREDLIDTYGETFLVRIETDDGHVGLGESHQSAAASLTFLNSPSVGYDKRGVRETLLGRDPRDRATLMEELDSGNFAIARRGVGKGVLSAIDTALWDLAARAQGVPLWQLLWGEAATAPMAYGTVHTGRADYAETIRRLPLVMNPTLAHGYTALKAEPTIDCTPEDMIGDYCVRFRDMLPPDVAMFVDFGYRMPTAERAMAAIDQIAHLKPEFVETPCAVDELYAWRDVVKQSPIPIAGAELLESPWEFQVLMDVAGVPIVQPWANRIGVSGVVDVIERARKAHARTIVGGWNATPVGVATTLHLAAGLGGQIAMEHPPLSAYGFGLRAAAGPELVPENGTFALPEQPGLGVQLDDAVIARFRTSNS